MKNNCSHCWEGGGRSCHNLASAASSQKCARRPEVCSGAPCSSKWQSQRAAHPHHSLTAAEAGRSRAFFNTSSSAGSPGPWFLRLRKLPVHIPAFSSLMGTSEPYSANFHQWRGLRGGVYRVASCVFPLTLVYTTTGGHLSRQRPPQEKHPQAPHPQRKKVQVKTQEEIGYNDIQFWTLMSPSASTSNRFDRILSHSRPLSAIEGGDDRWLDSKMKQWEREFNKELRLCLLSSLLGPRKCACVCDMCM